MKRMRAVLVLVLVAAVSLSLPGATSLAQEVLTNDSVIQMVKAGLPEAVVIAKIKGTATKFDLKTDSLVSLKKAGVSDKVLEAMVAAGSGSAAPTTAMPAPPAPAVAAGAIKNQDVIYQLRRRQVRRDVRDLGQPRDQHGVLPEQERGRAGRDGRRSTGPRRSSPSSSAHTRRRTRPW